MHRAALVRRRPLCGGRSGPCPAHRRVGGATRMSPVAGRAFGSLRRGRRFSSAAARGRAARAAPASRAALVLAFRRSSSRASSRPSVPSSDCTSPMRDVKASTALFEALASIARTTSLRGEFVAAVAGGSVRAAPFRAAAHPASPPPRKNTMLPAMTTRTTGNDARRSITTRGEAGAPARRGGSGASRAGSD